MSCPRAVSPSDRARPRSPPSRGSSRQRDLGTHATRPWGTLLPSSWCRRRGSSGCRHHERDRDRVPSADRHPSESARPRRNRQSSANGASQGRAVFDLPGVVQGVPGDAPDEVAGRPACAAARALPGHRPTRGCREGVKHSRTLEGAEMAWVARVSSRRAPRQSREIPGLGVHHVLGDAGELTPAPSRPLPQVDSLR